MRRPLLWGLYTKTLKKFQKILNLFFHKWVCESLKRIFYFRCFALRALEVGQEPLSKVRVQPPVQEWLLTHL